MQVRSVPEETQSKHPIEPSQTSEPLAREWSIDEKVRGLAAERHQTVLYFSSLPGLERGELVQQLKSSIRNVPAGFEFTQLGFSCKRSYSTVARVGSKQINFLQLLTKF